MKRRNSSHPSSISIQRRMVLPFDVRARLQPYSEEVTQLVHLRQQAFSIQNEAKRAHRRTNQTKNSHGQWNRNFSLLFTSWNVYFPIGEPTTRSLSSFEIQGLRSALSRSHLAYSCVLYTVNQHEHGRTRDKKSPP